MYLRLPLTIALLSFVFAGISHQAHAQSAAPPTPAPVSEPLPPLEVTTGQPKKKTAKSKAKAKAPAPVAQSDTPAPSTPQSGGDGGSGQATQPVARPGAQLAAGAGVPAEPSGRAGLATPGRSHRSAWRPPEAGGGETFLSEPAPRAAR